MVTIAGSDYQDTGSQVFVFNSSLTSYTFNVPIIDDIIFELTESFQAGLRFVGAAPQHLTLAPAQANIEIFDNDGE